MSNIIRSNPADNLQAAVARLIGNRPSEYMSADAARKHVNVTGAVLRGTGEAAVVGAVLGAVHASRSDGLDMKGIGPLKSLPIDGLAAGVLSIVAIATAQDDYAGDFSNAASAATAVFSFRKAADAITEMKIRNSGVTPGGGAFTPGKIGKASFGSDGWAPGSAGSQSEDPIIAAGRRL